MDVTLLGLLDLDQRMQELLSGISLAGPAAVMSEDTRFEFRRKAQNFTDLSLTRIQRSLKTAVVEDPNFYGPSATLAAALAPPLKSFTVAIEALANSLAGASRMQRMTPSSYRRLLSDGRACLAASEALWKGAVRELDLLLDVRMASFHRDRAIALLSTIFSWILSTLLVVLMGRRFQYAQRRLRDNQRVLAENQARKNAMFDSSLDAILSMDEKGVIVEFNPAAEAMFGYKKHADLGRALSECVILPSQCQGHLEGLDRLQKTGQSTLLGRRIEVTAMRADGTEFPIELALNRISLDEGTLYSANIRDLTESKRTEALLDAQQTRIVASSRFSALGEMAGGIAHEINNPLAIIHGRASQLKLWIGKGALDSEKVGSVADQIEKTAMRISKIVRGLKSFSRDSEDDPFEPSCLKEVLEETIALCCERFKNHGILLTPPAVPPGLRIDCRPTQISQVLLNLLNNSHDAVLALPEKWVRVDLEERDAEVVVTVTDSGKGVPPELREKIMQPFFTTKEVGSGTGLGLSISRGLIENHGGRLRLDAACPNTRFVVYLPKKMLTRAVS